MEKAQPFPGLLAAGFIAAAAFSQGAGLRAAENTSALKSPTARRAETFLDVSGGSPTVKPQVFSGFGLSLLGGDAVILDEIGGLELLSPEFSGALYRLLESDVPIIGVLKSPESAETMVKAQGMYREFLPAAERLRAFLLSDRNTLLYQCGQYDENALLLAQRWVGKYLND